MAFLALSSLSHCSTGTYKESMPNVIHRLGRFFTVRHLVAGPLILSYLLGAVLHLSPQNKSRSTSPSATPPRKTCACQCAGGCGAECCCHSTAAQEDESDQTNSKTLLVFKSPSCAGSQSFWLMLSAQIIPIPPGSFCLDVQAASLEVTAPIRLHSFIESPLAPPPRLS